MQSQIEATVTNGSPNSSKESSLRPLTPDLQTKENGINHGTITNGSTNGSNGSCNAIPDIDSEDSSQNKPNHNGQNSHDNEICTSDETKDNSKENGGNTNGSSNKDSSEQTNGQNHSNPTMPTFQPDPSKSAFITPNKSNEDFLLQQQQQQPLYEQQHDMKFGKDHINTLSRRLLVNGFYDLLRYSCRQ